jgi:YD repeat-containing protein
MKITSSLKVALGIAILSSVGIAQISPLRSAIDGSTPPAFAQGSPAGSYLLSGFETVNLFNGGLSFKLPLATLKGRGGIEMPLYLPIERKWMVQSGDNGGGLLRYAYSSNDPRYWPSIVGYSNPGRLIFRETGRSINSTCSNGDQIYTETLTRISFVQADGTEMEFVDVKGGGSVHSHTVPAPTIGGIVECPTVSAADRGRVWVTRDGSFATLILDAPLRDSTGYVGGAPVPVGGGVNAYIFLKDGTRYKFTEQQLVEIRDRNGNVSTFSYNSNRKLASMRDSLGRTVSITYDQFATLGEYQDEYETIQYPSSDGLTKQIEIHYCNLNGLNPVPESSPKPCPNFTGVSVMTFGALFGMNNSTSTEFNAKVPSYVKLPDGRTYRFQYNVYGELIRVILPTGGGFGYEWGPGVGETGNGVTYPGGSVPIIYRRVKKRTVYSNGNTIEGQTVYQVTHYNQSPNSCSQPYCTKVEVLHQNLAGETKQREDHYFHGSSASPDTEYEYNYYPSPVEGREYKVENVRLGPVPASVATVETLFEQRPCVGGEQCPSSIGSLRASPIDVRVRRTTTTLSETGQSSNVEVTSFDRYNNALVTQETGFNGLYRRKARSYLDVLNGRSYARPLGDSSAVNEEQPNVNTTIHIRGLIADESITDLSITPNIIVERTVFSYDQHASSPPRQAPRQSSSAPFRDPMTPSERGNLTEVARQLMALPPMIPSDRFLTTSYLYDDVGNVIRQVDPMGNQTNIAFGTAYAAAWPTSVTNALSHEVRNEYDFNTGFVKKFTDANLKEIVYSRAGDPLDRLTSVSFPDGGLIEFKYCDEGATSSGCETGMEPKSFRRKVRQDSCGTNVVRTDGVYDGLGRSVAQVQWENGTTKIVTRTQFDFMGRPFRVSNPTRPGFEEKWIQSLFDGAGRPSGTQYPDGSSRLMINTGSAVQTTDPAGKKMLHVKDAFGRLERVTEDPDGGLSSTTYYRYSAQDDLIGVCPGAAYSGASCPNGPRERVFTYDSLRRLAKATNPETGEARYGYNDAGSLVSKTDANGVVSTLGYDSIQRMTSVVLHTERLLRTA